MAVNSASGRVFASYGSVMVHTEPSAVKITDEQFQHAVPLKLDRLELSDEEFLKHLWGAEVTETAEEDGTVTRSISGRASFIGKYGEGTAVFRVGVSFQSSTYQPGQLGDTIDLLSAAHEAAGRAIGEALSGAELERRSGELEAVYRERKEETANSFADMVCGQTEDRGGEAAKVRRSVQALFTSFEAKYRVLAEDSDPDSWRDADLLVSAGKLRKIGMRVGWDDLRTEGLFTLRELEFAALRLRGGLDLRA